MEQEPGGAEIEPAQRPNWSFEAGVSSLALAWSAEAGTYADEDETRVEVTFRGTLQDALDLADALEWAGAQYDLAARRGRYSPEVAHEHERLGRTCAAQAVELSRRLSTAEKRAVNVSKDDGL